MAEIPSHASADGHGPAACGCPPDLADLVLAHHAAVYRYAFRLTGKQVDAEDLTQQTFLIAQQNLSQLRDRERAGGWLFAIARTCFLKGRSDKVPEASEQELAQLAAPTEALEEVDAESLQQALNELPDELRVLLVMFYFEDLSYREIAQQLELPEGTVMSRLSRAKARLRERLTTRFPKSSLRPKIPATSNAPIPQRQAPSAP